MIRSLKERTYQTLAYEFGGLLLIVPMYAQFTGTGLSESLDLLLVMSVLVMLWASFHNFIYDLVEWRCFGRIASDRSLHCRVLHILSLELTTAIVSVPLIMVMTNLSFMQALLVDIILTLAYTLYGFVFHYLFDYFRPVVTGEVNG